MNKLAFFSIFSVLLASSTQSAYSQPNQLNTQPNTLAPKSQPDILAQKQNAPTLLVPSAIEWTNVPDILPRGGQFALLEGNPKEIVNITIRLKIPANYQIPAAYAPNIQRLTVVSGTINFGIGDKFDMNNATSLASGSFVIIPAETHFYLWASEDSILQISGPGPWTLIYVNPKEDPRHNKIS